MLIVWCLALHDCAANGVIKVMTLMRSSWFRVPGEIKRSRDQEEGGGAGPSS